MDRTLEYDGAVAGAGRGFNSSGAESDGSAESEIDIDDAHARVHAEEAVVMEDPPLIEHATSFAIEQAPSTCVQYVAGPCS